MTRTTVRALLIACMAAIHLQWFGAGPRAMEACLQCLTPQGCFRHCDCTCPPGYDGAFDINPCEDDGTPRYSCRNLSVTPPMYTSVVCDTRECEADACFPNGQDCATDQQCCSGLCNHIMGECSDNPSPILINLQNNSANYQLTSAANGVEFDMNADGVADRMAWTSANTPIAFLVLDRNHNGAIDSGLELFGNHTLKSDGSKAAHGFDALADLDGGNQSDGKIDSSDQVYGELRLWVDANHNGVSETAELTTLAQAGIATIFTWSTESRRVDQHGNQYAYVGLALAKRTRLPLPLPRRIFDVFFAVPSAE